jgi:hypothetical protein
MATATTIETLAGTEEVVAAGAVAVATMAAAVRLATSLVLHFMHTTAQQLQIVIEACRTGYASHRC